MWDSRTGNEIVLATLMLPHINTIYFLHTSEERMRFPPFEKTPPLNFSVPPF